MALVAFDGYDHYNTLTDFYARTGALQYWRPGVGYPAVTTPGRNGFGKCLSFGDQDTTYFIFNQAPANAGVGFAFRCSAGNTCTATFRDSIAGSQQCNIYFGEGYRVTFSRGNTALAVSPNNVWVGNVWNWVEWWVDLSDTVGTCTLLINGVTIFSLTGLDNKNTANNWIDSFSFGGLAYFDDFYYADRTTGPGTVPFNGPVGDIKVQTLFPISDHSVQFTPSSGASNYAMVDETAMDSDTTYNHSSNPTDEDTFIFQSLASNIVSVFGIQLIGAYRKDDASVRTMKQVIITSATSYYAATFNLSDTSYSYHCDLWVINPNTSANWTVAQINGLAAGYNLVA